MVLLCAFVTSGARRQSSSRLAQAALSGSLQSPVHQVDVVAYHKVWPPLIAAHTQLPIQCRAYEAHPRYAAGEASLQYVAADATFLVCQMHGNKFAFRSLG